MNDCRVWKRNSLSCAYAWNADRVAVRGKKKLMTILIFVVCDVRFNIESI